MTDLQLYAYLTGVVFFFIGVYFNFKKKKEGIIEKQKILRNKIMYFFLILSFLCVVYSWI